MTIVLPGPDRTWLSFASQDSLPEDFPEFFTTEDMEAMQLEPDYGALWRLAKWKARYEELYGA